MNNKAYIYKITNKQNNKSYIGVTRDRSVFLRWSEHLSTNHKLNADVKLYGITSFIFEVLEEIDNISDYDLFKKESEYINKFNSIKYGYNQILSNKKARRRTHEYSNRAKKGLVDFGSTEYIGTFTNNTNNSNSFWSKLGDTQTCFISLLMDNNYLTRDNSKYNKVLKAVFYGRDQRYFKIQHANHDYVTDNINDIIDVLGLTFAENRHLPYKLKSYYLNNNYIELNLYTNDNEYRLKIYSPLLYEDEANYFMPIDTLKELLFDEN